MNVKKKNGARGLSRRQFLFIIIGLCLGALIAEGILLAKTLRKKPAEKTATITPSLTQTPEAGNGPFLEREVDHYKAVWKVATEYVTDLNGQRNPVMSHEYDRLGRETKRVTYKQGTDKPEETILFLYGREGFIMAHYLSPEEGVLLQKRCFFPTAEGVELLLWGYYLDVRSGERIIEEKLDDDGNLVLITDTSSFYDENGGDAKSEWFFDSDGIVRKHNWMSGLSSGETEFQYDTYGRLVGYGSQPVDYTCRGSQIVYEKDRTVMIDWLNGVFTYTYVDGVFDSYTRYMGFVEDWPGKERITKTESPYPATEYGRIYRPKGIFPELYEMIYVHEGIEPAAYACLDLMAYGDDFSVTVESEVKLRDDGQPVSYIFGGDEKRYEYDQNGKLTGYSCLSWNVAESIQLDDDWKLVKKTDLTTGEMHEYEWISIDVPVYKE